jgi:anti-sigma regulatory factor (Ser/Thr protein kinase)
LRELALHLLDIAENSISAKANNITIEVKEDTHQDRLVLVVQDDGVGMDEEMVRRVVDPFVTSRTTRKVGLGIPLLKAAAEGCNGCLTIESQPGKGTRVEVVFQRSHIDRMPLGDITSTILSLVVGTPEVHWTFRYFFDGDRFVFDDAPIKRELEDIPLTEPGVINFIRVYLQEGIQHVQPRLNNIN